MTTTNSSCNRAYLHVLIITCRCRVLLLLHKEVRLPLVFMFFNQGRRAAWQITTFGAETLKNSMKLVAPRPSSVMLEIEKRNLLSHSQPVV